MNKSAAVHIPVEHQSAPKEHWADKEVRLAAEDIATGKFKPVEDDGDLLGLGLQRGLDIVSPAKLSGDHKSELFHQTADSLALAQHPRVQEALAQLELEKRESKNTQEMIEKTQMLFELNQRASQANQWDGQGRWIGKDNEKARIGTILTPFQFLEKLEKVIGVGKVFLNRFAVAKRVALMVADTTTRPIILMPGQPEPPKNESGMVQVGTLQYPCGTEWMVMRFDEYGVPTMPKYLGWRTALLSMIQLGVITAKQAHKAFPVRETAVSSWYREQLFMLRSQREEAN